MTEKPIESIKELKEAVIDYPDFSDLIFKRCALKLIDSFEAGVREDLKAFEDCSNCSTCRVYDVCYKNTLIRHEEKVVKAELRRVLEGEK